MKQIGRTDSGSYLVELTKSEFRTLDELEQTMDGRASGWSFFGGDRSDDGSLGLSPLFQAIRRWVVQVQTVDGWQQVMVDLRTVLGVRREGCKCGEHRACTCERRSTVAKETGGTDYA
jgi:hypothetical protein